jgi:hypothetical protein
MSDAGSEIKAHETQTLTWWDDRGEQVAHDLRSSACRCTIESCPELNVPGGSRFSTKLQFSFIQARGSVHITCDVTVGANIWGLSGTIEQVMLAETQSQLAQFFPFAQQYFQSFRELQLKTPVVFDESASTIEAYERHPIEVQATRRHENSMPLSKASASSVELSEAVQERLEEQFTDAREPAAGQDLDVRYRSDCQVACESKPLSLEATAACLHVQAAVWHWMTGSAHRSLRSRVTRARMRE